MTHHLVVTPQIVIECTALNIIVLIFIKITLRLNIFNQLPLAILARFSELLLQFPILNIGHFKLKVFGFLWWRLEWFVSRFYWIIEGSSPLQMKLPDRFQKILIANLSVSCTFVKPKHSPNNCQSEWRGHITDPAHPHNSENWSSRISQGWSFKPLNTTWLHNNLTKRKLLL